MPDGIQAPESASAEVQEVLQELAKEGHEVAGIETKVEPKAEETKPEVKPEPEVKVETPASEAKPEVKQREPKFVPVSKHVEERHKRQEAEKRAEELEAKLAALTTKPTETQINDIRLKARELAESNGYDPEFMEQFADMIASEAKKGSPDVEGRLAEIEKLKAETEQKAKTVAQREQELAEEIGFTKEFDEVVKEFPELVNQKEDLKQLAFSEGNEKVSLRRLALEYLHDNPPGRKTAEKPLQGKKETNEVLDYANLTDEQFNNLTPKQMEEFEKWIGKHR